MKQKLVIIALIFTLAFGITTNVSAQWVQGNGISGGRGVTCFATMDTTLFAGTWDLGVFRSLDNGVSWTSVNAGLPSQIEVNAFMVIGTDLIEGAEFEGVFLSSNNGSSWFARNTGLPYNTIAGYPHINAFAHFGSNLFAGGDSLYLSTNNGTSWTRDSSMPNFQSFAQIGTHLFAGTNYDGVFHSTDKGISWMAADTGLPPMVRILAFAVIGTDIFASIHSGFNGLNGVFRSTNFGATWNSVNNGLTNNLSPSLLADGSNLFAGEDSVFLSTDRGATWKSVNTGLILTNNIQSLGVSGGNLLAGTLGSVWVRPLSQMVPASGITQIQRASSNIQTFPNPFSQSTTITFSSPESGVAEVTIVNLLGSEVARVFSGELDAGNHSFMWSKPPSLPEGMYECIVRINGSAQQTPIVFLP